MKNKYVDFVEQTFDFPQEDFTLNNNQLNFKDVDLMKLINEFGTPLRFSYLPSIGQQINKCINWFETSMDKLNYKGKYNYSYCTKSSHFKFILEECLKYDVNIETSSSFDIEIIKSLYEKGLISNKRYIICNGYKTTEYVLKIKSLIDLGFENVIPVIDNFREFKLLDEILETKTNIGIRIASEEEPTFEFYTSRLGIGYSDVVPFYNKEIKHNNKFNLKMLHFFVNKGIRDNAYYWNELTKFVSVYENLISAGASVDSLNIGGGFPTKNSLAFNFDYEYMSFEIIQQIKVAADNVEAKHPDIFTEFGSFTVAESGGIIFSIIDQKKQNDRERWNMIDGSFMTSLPDAWAINKRFVMLPINRWDKGYERVLLGGMTCDSDDYYNSEQHVNAIYLPEYNVNEPLYVGFFYCGAYQESISGYGGIKHCLIPSAKHILISKNNEDRHEFKLFRAEQTAEEMLKILGY